MDFATLQSILASAPAGPVSCDTEYLPDGEPGLSNLLGVSLSWPGSDGVYISVQHWENTPSRCTVRQLDADSLGLLGSFLASRKLWGWNVANDKEWIDSSFGIDSTWELDARIAWYLLDREQREVGYSLKRGQVKLLGWPEANDGHLRLQVASRGGSVDDGGHYLADLDVLGLYAAKDALSTRLAGEKLVAQFDEGDWKSHNKNLEYALFLAKSTRAGVEVDLAQLEKARLFYQEAVDKASAEIRIVCSGEIAQIEEQLYEKWKAGYKTEKGLVKAVASGRRPTFNPNSSAQRTILFHDIVGIPVFERSKKTGAPKSDKKTIARLTTLLQKHS